MIQRYDLTYDVVSEDCAITPVPESHEGRFVAYEDYAALEAKYSEVKRYSALESKYNEVKTYAVNCNDAWLNTKGDDISGSYVKFADYMILAAKLDDSEASRDALEAKYSEAQRELVALRSQVRDASALVKQLHDVVATIGVDDDAPKEEAWTVWLGGENPVPGEIVEYKLRNGGDKVLSRLSDHLYWGYIRALKGSDIIAYRVVKEG